MMNMLLKHESLNLIED